MQHRSYLEIAGEFLLARNRYDHQAMKRLANEAQDAAADGVMTYEEANAIWIAWEKVPA